MGITVIKPDRQVVIMRPSANRTITKTGSEIVIVRPNGNRQVTITMPTGFATAAQGLLANTALQPGDSITLETPVATTSGTAIDFTGIPAWVKRITVMFQGVSINASSAAMIRLGDSGGIETTGYVAYGAVVGGAATASAIASSGFILGNTTLASYEYSGSVTFSLLSSATNTWVVAGLLGSPTQRVNLISGHKSLSATLDRVRITTSGGSATFDLGNINISYE